MAFVGLANLVDLYDGYSKAFSCAGRSLLLLQDNGRHYAIDNRCPHMGVALASGHVAQGVITCKAHGIAFDLTSGRAQAEFAATLDCLKRYDIVYDGNKIGVDL